MHSKPERPKDLQTPGLTWRHQAKEGWTAWWQPTTTARKDNPDCPSSTRLWASHQHPTREEWAKIASACDRLQTQMKARKTWNGKVFDGTLGSLIALYQVDPISPFQKCRERVQIHEAGEFSRLIKILGNICIDKITHNDVLEWQMMFLGPDGDHYAMAGRVLSHVRQFMKYGRRAFGAKSGCKEVLDIFAELTANKELISGNAERDVFMTFEQCQAFIRQAPLEGFPSMGLALAFQWDLALRPKDVIGEWVPSDDTKKSRRDKWQIGIVWEEISPDLILRHKPSKGIKSPNAIMRPRRKEPEEWDLKICSLVTAELTKIPRGLRGPVVICELTGEPWREETFRKKWRQVARAAGIPDKVQCRDARSGAATEAELAGVDIDKVQTALVHSNKATTKIYTRGRQQVRNMVQEQRMAYRARQQG